MGAWTIYTGVGGGMGLVLSDPDTPETMTIFAPYTGIFYQNSQTRVAEVTDGMSNTLFFGESQGGLLPLWIVHPGEHPRMGVGWLRTCALGLAPIFGPNSNDYYHAQFQSMHPTRAVNFAFRRRLGAEHQHVGGFPHPLSSPPSWQVHDGTAYNMDLLCN